MIILFFAAVLMLGGCSGETIGVGRDDTAPDTGEESIAALSESAGADRPALAETLPGSIGTGVTRFSGSAGNST